MAVLYGFVVLVDPWDILPLSPPLPRVPISTNARFSFPALARSPAFDAAVFGTSTSRLLQPAQLNPAFGARFANLAMNSATAWEQTRLLEVFLRAHPRPRALIIGLDAEWCRDPVARTTSRPFPEWMYGANLWAAYAHMLSPYAVQEAANQFAVMVGLKRRRYGLDGYTSFVPDDAAYDRARVDAAFARWPPLDASPAQPGQAFRFPAMEMLRAALARVPGTARVVLYFTPNHLSQQGTPGTWTAAWWAACKREAGAVAAQRGAALLDFMVPSAITRDRDNYWDPLHYRVAVARHLAAALARGSDGDAEVTEPAVTARRRSGIVEVGGKPATPGLRAANRVHCAERAADRPALPPPRGTALKVIPVGCGLVQRCCSTSLASLIASGPCPDAPERGGGPSCPGRNIPRRPSTAPLPGKVLILRCGLAILDIAGRGAWRVVGVLAVSAQAAGGVAAAGLGVGRAGGAGHLGVCHLGVGCAGVGLWGGVCHGVASLDHPQTP